MSVHQVYRALELARSLNNDMTCSMLQTLLEIVLHDEARPTMSEIANRTGIPLASVSRHCMLFGPVRKVSPTGLDLIRMVEDYDDRRISRIELTNKGKLIAKQFRDIMN